ncbi:hypothetical protein NDU88_003378 [Pleurodeles waltl]|uniref:Secreted protein n=1 Tax=Pleurodeles waltl TaxID=8319 RepID=A0AAV7UYR5_PLEWA|nr:hypothetical protein NDU88_003378 [Pleurodeles waltl]
MNQHLQLSAACSLQLALLSPVHAACRARCNLCAIGNSRFHLCTWPRRARFHRCGLCNSRFNRYTRSVESPLARARNLQLSFTGV